MNDIQLDMFEVQLGSAILLQMRDSNGAAVRVLADAGVRGRYKATHVESKLATVFSAFDPNAPTQIDLMVGTHYDEDHLKGLSAVVKNTNIAITEAWLPPVVASSLSIGSILSADGGSASLDLSIEDHDLSTEKGLQGYLESQLAICKACDQRIGFLRDVSKIESEEEQSIHWLEQNKFRDEDSSPENGAAEVEPPLESAGQELTDLNTTVRDLYEQLVSFLSSANRQLRELGVTASDIVAAAKDCEMDFSHGRIIFPPLFFPLKARHVSARASLIQLSYIQKSTAKSGITAVWLNQLVTELKNRNIPIQSRSITAGIPEYFLWDPVSARFQPNSALYQSSQEPKFTLLGPSQQLVNKHQHLLPIGVYFSLLGFVAKKPTTPSNELSYVLLFESKGQAVLLTGDAGCVDFWDSGANRYFPSLLAAIKTPSIIQIAHHGGRNADFYNVLLNSSYAGSGHSSYLLLSHATHDRSRPSKQFRDFLDQLPSGQGPLHLVFTSKPRATASIFPKYKPRVAHVTGYSHSVSEGDVRLSFGNGAWAVDKHAVQP